MATPSEMCFTPQVTKDPVIVSFDDHAYFAFPDLLSTKSCNASMCRDLLLGIRYTCWTANDVEKAYIGSKKLNKTWSSWIKHPLTQAENGPCLSLLPVPFLWHRFCLIQYHVGPSQTFKKEPIKVDSQKVCMKHMGGESMEVSILKDGRNNEGQLVVKENSSLTIVCNATGQPPPSVQWAYPVNITIGGDVVINNATLYFDSVQSHHEGTYTCYGRQYVVVYSKKQQSAIPRKILKYKRVEIVLHQERERRNYSF